MRKLIAYVLGVLSLASATIYTYSIVKFFRESALYYYDGIGKVLTGIHVASAAIASLLLLLGLLINHIRMRQVAVGGLIVAGLTGMRNYLIVSFSPPLWRSLLLLIPLALFGLFWAVLNDEF
jgi:hypothetical protein